MVQLQVSWKCLHNPRECDPKDKLFFGLHSSSLQTKHKEICKIEEPGHPYNGSTLHSEKQKEKKSDFTPAFCNQRLHLCVQV